MKQRAILLVMLLLFISVQAIGQTDEIKLDVRERVLSNGMTILVLENHSAPTFSAVIRFNTGAIDERPGITGISHLLEHMMFKGSKIMGTSDFEAEIPLMAKIDSLAHLMYAEHVKLQNPLNPRDSARYKELRKQIADVQAEQAQYIVKDELWGTYLKNGAAALNAFTSNDATNYFVSLPKNKLEIWVFMEADRMQNTIFREVYSERDVVTEERRLSIENNPRGTLEEAINATAFWATPYEWPVLGWMSDLQNIMREDVDDYYRIHYAPANAVAAIVGDVKADQVFSLCEKYFGQIPPQTPPPAVVTKDNPQQGERRSEVEYDANPSGYIAWRVPQVGHPDVPVLDFIANILSEGRTSRFYRNIKEKKIGDVRASVDQTRLPNVFSCDVTPMGDHTFAEVEDAVCAEIDRLKTSPVSSWELQKIRNQMRASLLRSLDSNLRLAFRLTNSRGLTGDWRHFLNWNDAINKVTADDIIQVAGKYFTQKNRTVVQIVRSTEEDADAPAQP